MLSHFLFRASFLRKHCYNGNAMDIEYSHMKNKITATVAAIVTAFSMVLPLDADYLPVISEDLHGTFYLAKIDSFSVSSGGDTITSTYPHHYDSQWNFDMYGEFQFGGACAADIDVDYSVVLSGPGDTVYDGGTNGRSYTTHSYNEYAYPGGSETVWQMIDGLVMESPGIVLFTYVDAGVCMGAYSLYNSSNWASAEYQEDTFTHYP